MITRNDIVNAGQYVANEVQNQATNAGVWAMDNPYKAGGLAIASDVVTNGGDMSADLADFFFSNDGLAQNSPKAGAREFAEVLEETNDVLFNWTDMATEGLKGATSMGGTLEDGNLAYGVAEGLDGVADMLTDGEEIIYNGVRGEGFTDPGTEWYEEIGNLFGGGEAPADGGAVNGTETATQTGTETATQTTTETGTQTATGTPTETATETATETPAPGTDYDFNAVFDQATEQELNNFFQSIEGEPVSYDMTWNGESYEVQVTDAQGEVYTEELSTINEDEATAISQANADGEIYDLLDESEYVPNGL